MRLWTEHKPANCMMGIVSKFCKDEELITGICAGKVGKANACLQLPQNCRSIDYKRHFRFFAGSLSSLLKVLAPQVLNPESDLVGNGVLL